MVSIKISFKKNFFFNVHLRHTWKKCQKSETTFSKQLCPNIFFMFSVLGSRMKHKKVIENQTAVYFCLHHESYKFYPLLLFVTRKMFFNQILIIFDHLLSQVKIAHIDIFKCQNVSFKIVAPAVSSIWRARLFTLDFLQFYFIKLIFFL